MTDARFEVDLLQAMFMLDVPEEVLGKLAEEGKLKTRRVDGTIYFLREQIEQLLDRQIEQARSDGNNVSIGGDSAGVGGDGK